MGKGLNNMENISILKTSRGVDNSKEIKYCVTNKRWSKDGRNFTIETAPFYMTEDKLWCYQSIMDGLIAHDLVRFSLSRTGELVASLSVLKEDDLI